MADIKKSESAVVDDHITDRDIAGLYIQLQVLMMTFSIVVPSTVMVVGPVYGCRHWTDDTDADGLADIRWHHVSVRRTGRRRRRRAASMQVPLEHISPSPQTPQLKVPPQPS